jgi:hypothetical protein
VWIASAEQRVTEVIVTCESAWLQAKDASIILASFVSATMTITA